MALRLIRDAYSNGIFLVLANNSRYFLTKITEPVITNEPSIVDFNISLVSSYKSKKYRIGKYTVNLYSFAEPDIEYFPTGDEIEKLSIRDVYVNKCYFILVSKDVKREYISHIESELTKDEYFICTQFQEYCVVYMERMSDKLKTIFDLLGVKVMKKQVD